MDCFVSSISFFFYSPRVLNQINKYAYMGDDQDRSLLRVRVRIEIRMEAIRDSDT